MNLALIFVLVGLVLCPNLDLVLCAGPSLQPYFPLKECTPESIVYAANFIQNKCDYIDSDECFADFAECSKNPNPDISPKGFDANEAASYCAKALNYSADQIKKVCDTSPLNYETTLQIVCCLKTRSAQTSGLDYGVVEEIAESCYKKDGSCASANSCNAN